MSNSPDDWTHSFDELVHDLREDRLTPERAEMLEQQLQNQPGARRRFAEQMQLAATLAEYQSPQSAVPAAVVPSVRPTGGNRRLLRRTLVSLFAGTAALVFLLAATNWFDLPSSATADSELLDKGVAVITRSVDDDGQQNSAWSVGAVVPPGALQIDSGLIQLEFYRGAVVVVEGPAQLNLVNADRVICDYGKLRAHVPAPAQGFTVVSSQVRVVDRGTEFGMNVSRDGTASVHVFDGRVDLYAEETANDAGAQQEVLTDQAVAIDPDGRFSVTKYDADLFTSAETLQQLADEAGQNRLKEWQEFSRQLRNDPRLLVYYSFERDDNADRILRSQSAEHSSLDGAIVGCVWAEGRWPGKQALEFKRPSDRVRVHIPGEYQSLTYSAWVRIDGLDRVFNALMLTNGFNPNEPHWQLRREGNLVLGVCPPSGNGTNYESQPILDITQLGRWIHLAVTFDAGSQQVTHFADGRVVAREKMRDTGFQLTLGDTEIGNWGQPETYIHTKIRNLNGRMDELAVFHEALSEDEIRWLYDHGRP